jgi:aryl-alcohol dehydrogenase-like predicted oxidoreductase
METTSLGRGGPAVSRVGLGLMGMSGTYGPADEDESIATIHAALDAGITLLDTGDFYGMGHNEMLLGRALRGVPRDSVFIQVKFGARRDPAGGWLGNDASPAAVRHRWPTRCAGSAPTTWTCTSPPGSIRGCRSRTRSARSGR